jgi:hypothetical protein
MVVQALIAPARPASTSISTAPAPSTSPPRAPARRVEAVKTSVNPKVIDCPNPGPRKTTIDAVAKDGIVVKVKARVTVRTNLDRFVGGATEETIIARVGEGIVTTIGSSDSYKDVLENPDRISKTVLDKALDSQHRLRNPLHRHRGRRCRRERRRETPGGTGRGQQAHRPGPGGSPPRDAAVAVEQEMTRPRRRKCAPGSSKPRPRSRWPWPRPSAPATSASWTTTR